MGVVDNTTWAALGLTLTLIGLFLSYLAYRRHGLVAGLRGAAWSLLPLAAGLTRTLKLVAEISDDIASWAVHLVFSPLVWLGIAVAGLSAVLFVASGVLSGRRTPDELPRGRSRAAARPPVDDDLAEIEEILRKHGIQ